MSLVSWFFNVVSALIVKHKMRKPSIQYSPRNIVNRSLILDRNVYESDTLCLSQLRMTRRCFFKLCDMLQTIGGLTDTRNTKIEEQVAIFLHIIAHNIKNRVIVCNFYRSGETVSRHFTRVFDAVLRLHPYLLKKPEPVPEDSTDGRWKWFKFNLILIGRKMQSLWGRVQSAAKHTIRNSSSVVLDSALSSQPNAYSSSRFSRLLPSHFQLPKNLGSLTESLTSCRSSGMPSVASIYRDSRAGSFLGSVRVPHLPSRSIATSGDSDKSISHDTSASAPELPPRLKFKRLDKTARNIMQIIDKEEVEKVKTQREMPEIKPGYIIQLRLEVPENKRRVSLVKGIVIARRNAGLHTTIRLRRMVAGVGIESLLPLYSPNIKEIKVLDKKKVRRAKLYYLRDKLNPLKKR